jgi:group II intron reverse transcriptase/maturase
MATDRKIFELQQKLYLKSKQEYDFKFYSIFDKIYRKDILLQSYQKCRANKGGAGVDNITFAMIDKKGVEEFVDNLSLELKNNNFKPSPVKRVEIPKADGKVRLLGVPTIKDRVVQMAIKLMIEPIYEAVLHPNSFGYRPKRSAGEAVVQIAKNLNEGYTTVYDADLSKYFDTIPHQKMMEKLERKISDYKVLNLIRKFLKAPIQITNHNGNKEMLSNRQGVGTPQGGVISPLLANIYLNDFVTLINEKTPCRLISYADDFVIMHKENFTDEQLGWFVKCIEREGLTINLQKTSVVDTTVVGSLFNFLGFAFKRVRSIYNPIKGYIRIEPSTKAIKKFKKAIADIVKHKTSRTMQMMIAKINPIIRGWMNYFGYIGNFRDIFVKLDGYINHRFYQWAKRLSHRPNKSFMQNSWEILAKNGLILLRLGRANVKGLR